jgi:hypothetical protein
MPTSSSTAIAAEYRRPSPGRSEVTERRTQNKLDPQLDSVRGSLSRHLRETPPRVRGFSQSGRLDLNQRPFGPQPMSIRVRFVRERPPRPPRPDSRTLWTHRKKQSVPIRYRGAGFKPPLLVQSGYSDSPTPSRADFAPIYSPYAVRREPSPTYSEGNMSETVWILDPTKSRPPSKLRYHTSPDCTMPRKYGATAVEKREAESRGYTPCRRSGPCNSATKAGPRPGRNRQMVTGGKR